MKYHINSFHKHSWHLFHPSTCFKSGRMLQACSPLTSMQGVRLTSKLLLSTTFRAPSNSSRSSKAMILTSFLIYSRRRSGRVFVSGSSLCSYRNCLPGLLWPWCMSAVFNWKEKHAGDCRLYNGYSQVSKIPHSLNNGHTILL